MGKINNRNCSVPGCKTLARKNPDLGFHLFPRDDQMVNYIDEKGRMELINRRQAWIKALKMEDKSVSNYIIVCSKHFVKNDYFKTPGSKKWRLKRNAIPSQNLPDTLKIKNNTEQANQKWNALPPVKSCCVGNCKNSEFRDPDLNFYSLPSKRLEPEQRNKWIEIIKEKGFVPETWEPTTKSRICSAHFIGGKKSSDEQSLSYIPSIFSKRPPSLKQLEAKPVFVDIGKLDEEGSKPRLKNGESKIFKKRKLENALQEAETKQETKYLLSEATALNEALKATSNTNDFLKLTCVYLEGVCKELDVSNLINKNLDNVQMPPERITISTSMVDGKDTLTNIFIVEEDLKKIEGEIKKIDSAPAMVDIISIENKIDDIQEILYEDIESPRLLTTKPKSSTTDKAVQTLPVAITGDSLNINALKQENERLKSKLEYFQLRTAQLLRQATTTASSPIFLVCQPADKQTKEKEL